MRVCARAFVQALWGWTPLAPTHVSTPIVFNVPKPVLTFYISTYSVFTVLNILMTYMHFLTEFFQQLCAVCGYHPHFLNEETVGEVS